MAVINCLQIIVMGWVPPKSGFGYLKSILGTILTRYFISHNFFRVVQSILKSHKYSKMSLILCLWSSEVDQMLIRC